jgi:signal transduction histidine kinase
MAHAGSPGSRWLSSRWLSHPLKEQWAAIITWIAFSYIQLHGIWHNTNGAWPATMLLAASLLLFMVLFLRLHHESANRQSFTAIGIMWLCLWLNAAWVPNGFTPGLAVLWVIILTPLLPSSRIYWMIIPASLPYAIVNLLHGYDYNSVMMLVVCATFQYFAIFAMHKAQSEQRARQHLAQLHQELLTAQQQLQQQAADAERLRIARDLHDSLGHHLTALVIQLQLAEHQAKTMSATTLVEATPARSPEASTEASSAPFTSNTPMELEAWSTSAAPSIQQSAPQDIFAQPYSKAQTAPTPQHLSHVQQLALCHQLAKNLLHEIRQTVGQWRQPAVVKATPQPNPMPTAATYAPDSAYKASAYKASTYKACTYKAKEDFLQQCNHFRQNMAPLHLSVRLANALQLDPLNSALLSRVTQEACTNSVRHAHASRAWLRIFVDDADHTKLCYQYWDNGQLAQWPLQPGNGLDGMRERIEDAGGTLWLQQKCRRRFSHDVIDQDSIDQNTMDQNTMDQNAMRQPTRASLLIQVQLTNSSH